MNEQIKNDKRYYCNSTGIEVTNVDLKLIANFKDKNGTEPLCEIIFSPEQAKLTMLMLQQAIQNFEDNTRKININPNGINKVEGK
ncbi:MAG: hypothetical protein IJH39_09825 [Clostridia bacterium]|nr:hypothetical protein [Clostridia bacterium]